MALIDDVAAELYTLQPSQFVAARAAAARQARDAGDRAAATAIGRLRRPTTAAWAVNLLVRYHADEVAELLSLGEELRLAQQNMQAEQLRQLGQRRREMIGALSARARQLAVDAGHPLTGAAPAEVERSLAAALADADSAEAVRSGRLVRPLQHIGLGMPPLDKAAPDPAAPDPAAPDPAAPDPAALDQLACQRRKREERVARDLARVSQELAEATTRAQRADEQVRDVAERIADVERRLAALQRERDQMQREHADAQQRARSASRVRDEVERQVRRLLQQQRHAEA